MFHSVECQSPCDADMGVLVVSICVWLLVVDVLIHTGEKDNKFMSVSREIHMFCICLAQGPLPPRPSDGGFGQRVFAHTQLHVCMCVNAQISDIPRQRVTATNGIFCNTGKNMQCSVPARLAVVLQRFAGMLQETSTCCINCSLCATFLQRVAGKLHDVQENCTAVSPV